MNFPSIFKWQIVLSIAVIIILLIPVVTWPNLNACQNEGALRMSLTLAGDPVEKISGQIRGEGASRYRAQGAKVILYAKTDKWYNKTEETPAGVKMEQPLGLDCSWQIEKVHAGQMYAAFLVDKMYQQPDTIPKTSNTDLPPLPIDGEKVLAWTLWSSVSLSSNSAIDWLMGQMGPNEIVRHPLPDRAGLIIGYRIPETDEAYPYIFSRSWIYDDALALIGFTMGGNIDEALTILNALKGQIQADGRIGFSCNTHNDWCHEYYHSGAIAWVGYAFIFYQHRTGDNQSQAAAERIADYLLTLQDLNPTSRSYGSIRDDPNVFSYSTDQNIIAYFFLRDLGRFTEKPKYMAGADLIKDSLLNRHWNEGLNRFNQQINTSSGGLIEVASLGALFLEAVGQTNKAHSSLSFVERAYQPVLVEGTINGYAPYEDRSTVWTQGSLQMALAYRRLGNRSKSEAIIKEIIKLQDATGGIPYAMPKVTIAATGEEFQAWPGVAGTAWLAIVLSEDTRFLSP